MRGDDEYSTYGAHENFDGVVVRDGSKQLCLTRVNLPNGQDATGLAQGLVNQVMLGSQVLCGTLSTWS